VEPASDNRPYFYHTFKWNCIPVLKKYFGDNWLASGEIGYFILLAVLAISILLSVVLILLPLLFLRGVSEVGASVRRPAVLAYFFSIGIGFMFLEMSFFQKFILFLGHPIFSISVILAAFLAFSGLGSYLSKTIIADTRKRIFLAVIGIAGVSVVYLLVLTPVLALFISGSDYVKVAVSALLIAPLAFCMGFPFPSAISILERRAKHLIPWAWGVNGCASVISPVLATLFAISFGFRIVVACALGMYVPAAAAVFLFERRVRE
jgi:predicted membrane-bound spermidine synthase